jgi:argininosuccinate synthase
MRQRVALAYSGSIAATAAVAWLRERHGAEVVTVTLDLGQPDDLEGLRSRALASGAARAHVVDARETFVREWVVPALREAVSALEQLAHPLIARTLVEVARMEGADAVAHAADEPSFDDRLAAMAPRIRILAPAREWAMDQLALLEYARARSLPAIAVSRQRHLLLRETVAPARVTVVDAHVEIVFAGGMPASINGVEMTPAEAIDSLSLIAGQHGIGYGEAISAPAAIVLRAAYQAAGREDAAVRLALRPGRVDVAAVHALTLRN